MIGKLEIFEWSGVGGGGVSKTKTFKEMYIDRESSFNWHLQMVRVGGGGGLKKSLSWGLYGYLLKLHNFSLVKK